MNIFAKVLLWQGKPEAFYILGTSEGKLAPVVLSLLKGDLKLLNDW